MAYKYIVNYYLFIFIISLTDVMAASCCGGGGSLIGPILGDHRAKVSMGFSHSAVTHLVDSSGRFFKRESDKTELIEALNLSGNYQLKDLWQVGVAVPFKKNTYENLYTQESSSGVGDISLSLTYEFLPEYYYHYLKPRGFVFFEQKMNNGESIYDSNKTYMTDAMGTGYLTSSMGLYFYKIIEGFDFFSKAEYHFSRPEKFQLQNNDDILLKPGDGHSFSISVGKTPEQFQKLHFGGDITYIKENSSRISGDQSSVTDVKEIYEVGISLGYAFENNNISVKYTDQSFLARAKNILATKSLSVGMTYFFGL